MRRASAGLWPLLLLVGVAAASAGQDPPASADAQKLEAAWAFLRARSARDYAIATPNGFRLWLKHFTVVQWDQRGAGRTFGKNPDAPPQAITIARMTQDGVELADVLAARSLLRVRGHGPGG